MTVMPLLCHRDRDDIPAQTEGSPRRVCVCEAENAGERELLYVWECEKALLRVCVCVRCVRECACARV